MRDIPIEEAADVVACHFKRTCSAKGVYKELLKHFRLSEEEAQRFYTRVKDGIEKAQEEAVALDMGDASIPSFPRIRAAFLNGVEPDEPAGEVLRKFGMQELGRVEKNAFAPTAVLDDSDLALCLSIARAKATGAKCEVTAPASAFSIWAAACADGIDVSTPSRFRLFKDCLASLCLHGVKPGSDAYRKGVADLISSLEYLPAPAPAPTPKDTLALACLIRTGSFPEGTRPDTPFLAWALRIKEGGR